MNKVEVLSNYMPEAAAPIISRWIDYFKCEFKISRGRSTKYGDYRHPFKEAGHRISVNYNLNQYAFLVTTVHEFAHLLTWNEHKRKAKPHGQEWKNNFKRMMKPFFEQDIFPGEVKHAIQRYLENPSASSCTDLNLFRMLKRYDKQTEKIVMVEQLTEGTLFTFKTRLFKKGSKIRKRYRCQEMKSGVLYLFNPLAEVIPVPQD